MLGRSPGQLATARTILLGDALPPPSPQLQRGEMLKVRFVAMNFYGMFENYVRQREANYAAFAASVGETATRAQAAGYMVHQAKLAYRQRGNNPPNARPPFRVAATNISTGTRPFIVLLSLPVSK